MRKKLGAEDARVAFYQPDLYFRRTKINVLRCIPLERRLKLVENYEDHSRDLLEDSFIGDYIDEFKETRMFQTARTVPILEGLRSKLDRDGVQ